MLTITIEGVMAEPGINAGPILDATGLLFPDYNFPKDIDALYVLCAAAAHEQTRQVAFREEGIEGFHEALQDLFYGTK